MLKEFKEFALRGNLVDLAIGFVIGAAFTGLVQSMVADIIMPIIGVITGGVDFSNHYVQLAGAPQATLAEARKAGATIAYGNFLTLIINFVIIAFVLFLIIKAVNHVMTRGSSSRPRYAVVLTGCVLMTKPTLAAPPRPPWQEVLLTEIRDLLARRP